MTLFTKFAGEPEKPTSLITKNRPLTNLNVKNSQQKNQPPAIPNQRCRI